MSDIPSREVERANSGRRGLDPRCCDDDMRASGYRGGLLDLARRTLERGKA